MQGFVVRLLLSSAATRTTVPIPARSTSTSTMGRATRTGTSPRRNYSFCNPHNAPHFPSLMGKILSWQAPVSNRKTKVGGTISSQKAINIGG